MKITLSMASLLQMLVLPFIPIVALITQNCIAMSSAIRNQGTVTHVALQVCPSGSYMDSYQGISFYSIIFIGLYKAKADTLCMFIM